MNYSKAFIQTVIEATNLVDLISENGITLKKSGSNYKGICPFHSEKTPSFSVNPIRGFFYCFGCKMSGDGIKFLMQYNRLNFTEAIEELAKRANIPLEKKYKNSSNIIIEKDEGFDCLQEAVLFYNEKLLAEEGYKAVKYLRKRNFSEKMWKEFNLGLSPEEWQGLKNFLKQKKKRKRIYLKQV